MFREFSGSDHEKLDVDVDIMDSVSGILSVDQILRSASTETKAFVEADHLCEWAPPYITACYPCKIRTWFVFWRMHAHLDKSGKNSNQI